MKAIHRAARKTNSGGLLPILLSPYTGEMYLSTIRLGSRGDSYYEYLIKQYIQTKCVSTHLEDSSGPDS